MKLSIRLRNKSLFKFFSPCSRTPWRPAAEPPGFANHRLQTPWSIEKGISAEENQALDSKEDGLNHGTNRTKD